MVVGIGAGALETLFLEGVSTGLLILGSGCCG